MYNTPRYKTEKVAPDFVNTLQNDEERVLCCEVKLTDF